MSRFLRYKNPVICEHLASQYVAGLMTARVRARMNTLLEANYPLNQAVAYWADVMADIQVQLPEKQPSNMLWENIESALSKDQSSDVTFIDEQQVPWWQNLLLWQATGIIGMATSFALVLVLSFAPSIPDSVGPSYLAAMSVSDGNENVEFVISAYKKTGDKPSWLQLQWSKHASKTVIQSLHLWAEERTSGKLTYIGLQPEGRQWSLNKVSWTAIANSGRLLVTSNQQLPNQTNILFTGPCIQLKSWKQQVI